MVLEARTSIGRTAHSGSDAATDAALLPSAAVPGIFAAAEEAAALAAVAGPAFLELTLVDVANL